MGVDVVPIKLAREAPFRLGAAEVDPPGRRITRGETSEVLEPRVMQVLVLLAQADGLVVSRDELIERCWGGRIVGENAINRVISRIRQVAAELGEGSFELETITKVGYRLVRSPQLPAPFTTQDSIVRAPASLLAPVTVDAPPEARPSWLSRRGLIGSGLAVASAGAAGLFLFGRAGKHQPHPEALELYRRGQIAQRQGQPEQVRQAVAFMKQATEIDPLYAEAWGGLALAYRHILEGYAEHQKDGLPQLIEAAARRALELDPGNADAQVALVIIRPNFRNWGRIETDLLRVGAQHPDHWFVQAQLGIIRYETGRWREGLVHTERQLEIEPFIPVPHYLRAQALWSIGRLQEAEAVIDAAIERWPGDFRIWNLKYNLLLFSGRAASALAFIQDPQSLPEHLRSAGVDTRVTAVRAIEQREPAAIAATLADIRPQLASQPAAIQLSAPVLLAIGRHDLVVAGIERYLLGAGQGELGPATAPPQPFERRYTSFLFMPNLAALWPDPRFAAILDRIGLEAYWRDSGTLPDYRRG